MQPNRTVFFSLTADHAETRIHGQSRYTAHSVILAIALLALCFWTPAAQAQTTQDLQQQIQQMKQLYEQQISALEGRIASLEQSNRAAAHATQEGTVSVTDLQAEVARDVAVAEQPKLTKAQKTEIEQTELANTPTYDEIQDSTKVVRELQQQVKQFEFHGYLRSGQGLNSEGGQMVAFQAPGAPAKYRLGNEADTYGELIFVNNWINPPMNRTRHG
jgi:maltoporin